MNIQRTDLNLLRVFLCIYEERHLHRAAQRMNLSQSAMSHALARLRESVGDELFVRSADGMMPTARALAMAGPLRDALQQIAGALNNEPFVAATARREFVIAASDYVSLLLLERLSAKMQALAPHVNLVVRPVTRIDLAGQLDLGRIDLAIGVFADIPPRLNSMPLWTQSDTFVMRAGHPLAGAALRIDDVTAYPLVAVSLGGTEEGAVDGFLSERGLARESEMFDRAALPPTATLRILLPHALAVPSLLQSSDMLAILPSSLAQLFVARHGLASAAPPYPVRERQMQAVWHTRNDDDPAQAWLRALLA
ncbi:LysR family transcriptional regulator [Duganella sp. PWIR1]